MCKTMVLETLMFALTSLFEFLLLYHFLSAFLGKPSGRDGKVMLIGGGCVALLTVINVLDMRALNTAMTFVLAMCFTLIFRGRTLKKMLLVIVFIGLSFLSEMITIVSTFLFVGKEPSGTLSLTEIQVGAAISKMILLFIIMLVTRLFPSKYFYEDGPVPVGLWVMPLIAILNMHFTMSVIRYRLYDSNWIFWVMILLCIALSWSMAQVILVYNSSMQKKDLEIKLRLSQQKEKAQEIVFHTLERNNRECRSAAHDFANHLMHIDHLYATQSPDTEKYYKEVLDLFREKGTQELIDVGNPIVSQSLYHVQNQCRNLQIDFTTNVTCCNLSFLDFLDASSIFDNLFDNAITACTGLSPGEHPFITLSLSRREDFVIIKLVNSKANPITEMDGLPTTTKSNGELHGYGMKNIRDTARKYGGEMSYSYTPETFSVILRLKNIEPME